MDNTSPCPEAIEAAAPPGRRTFLRVVTGLFSAVAATMLSIPLVGYFLGVRRRAPAWVDLGAIAEFPLNVTRRLTFENSMRQPWDGMTALTIVYARYQGTNDAHSEQFLVLSANCAHLGCPVTWFQQSGLFMCPCHGGVYYADGGHASGPPPRGLYHCEWRVHEGRLQVQSPHYPTLQDPLVPEHRATA